MNASSQLFSSKIRTLAQNLPREQKEQLASSSKNVVTITGMPEGFDVFCLGQVATISKKPLAIILEDDKQIELYQELFALFHPHLPCLSFPPWDCSPYDRLSPRTIISAQRVQTLTRLLSYKKTNDTWILLTTPEGLLQKVLGFDDLRGHTLTMNIGQTISRQHLITFFQTQGYRRVETVYEPGDYALRGSIIDVFPASHEMPVRVDFFDEEIESLKFFNPHTQRSEKALSNLILGGVTELPLGKTSIKRFRQAMRENFGVASLLSDQAKAAIQGRVFQGLEHFLPFFCHSMINLISYLPESLQWVFSNDKIQSLALQFQDEIQNNYRQRCETNNNIEEAYYAPSPCFLYENKKFWEDFESKKNPWILSSSTLPTDVKNGYFNAGGTFGRDFSDIRSRNREKLYESLVGYIRERQLSKCRVILSSNNENRLQRLKDVLQDVDSSLVWKDFSLISSMRTDVVYQCLSSLQQGFCDSNITFITDQDVFGRHQRPLKDRKKSKSPVELLQELNNFSEGDYIVHEHHGIALYNGLRSLTINNITHDFLELIYAQDSKLLLPVEHLNILSRYSGGENTTVSLDRLGTSAWQAKRAKIKKGLLEIADKLLKTAAQRNLRTTKPWIPLNGLYEDFCSSFPYDLTPDQQRAEQDIIEDLGRGFLMDRLICGDVGFGKTEIALRAAFIGTSYKKQICLIVPTTLLCRQHFQTFVKRFNDFGIKIEQLSRLVKPHQAKKIKNECQEGKIDILITTHAIFGKTVLFKDLGLVILDEEQHYGVLQKESLKKRYPNVHILTLSATPIPRTLQLSLSGIRPMSLIATPPIDRLSVRTVVMTYDAMIIKEALMREYHRGGQIFYVCPKLKDLALVRSQLEELVPNMSVATAHGQMKADELEEIMIGFQDARYDILLSTNIVESGIDIPNANTLIVHKADMFGLSQSYQLRGRVGRGKIRGYAYFTLPFGKKTSSNAKKRLKVIQSLDSLGAGFSIASHDMDIRGAGNLVGEAQAGHVKEVGAVLYQQMLKEAIQSVQEGNNTKTEEDLSRNDYLVQINLGVTAHIPESYIEDLDLRLRLYKRLASCSDTEEINLMVDELEDRFGSLPLAVKNMFEMLQLKVVASKLNIERIEAGPKGATLSFHKNTFKNPLGLVKYISSKKGLLKLRPDQTLVILTPMPNPQQRYTIIKQFLLELSAL